MQDLFQGSIPRQKVSKDFSSPDIAILGDNQYFHNDNDAYPFIIYSPTSAMMSNIPEISHADLLNNVVQHILGFDDGDAYSAFGDIRDVVYNKIIKGYDDNTFNRYSFGYSGRIWTSNNILSMWAIPTPQMFPIAKKIIGMYEKNPDETVVCIAGKEGTLNDLFAKGKFKLSPQMHEILQMLKAQHLDAVTKQLLWSLGIIGPPGSRILQQRASDAKYGSAAEFNSLRTFGDCVNYYMNKYCS